MSTTLTSLAIVKVNYDRRNHDSLDDFLPFVADRLYHMNSDVVSIPELKEAIRQEFGLLIPGGVLRTLSRRCARAGLVVRRAGVLEVNRDKLPDYDLSAVRADARRQHEALLDSGLAFAQRVFGTELDRQVFEAALSSFVRDNGAPLLATVVEGHPLLADSARTPDELRFLVASFIAWTINSEPTAFAYLSTVVKGSVLATALYFPNSADLDRKLKGLHIYLDTTLLLRAVGACGPDLQELSRECVLLASAQGASVHYFDHTMSELQGVLRACVAAVERKQGEYFGESIEYMVSTGWEPSDVIELSSEIEVLLARLGITMREHPEHEASLTLDERRLEETLQTEINYRNPTALIKDVDSLTAVYRLRRGREFVHIEKARAIFVTHNTALVRAARTYGGIEDFDRGSVPLAMSDFVLTSLLWLKQPNLRPDLPERSIIADCYAAMRPDDRVWLQYVRKIEQMREQGAVSVDDYVVLRQSLLARSLIMYDTRLDPEAFTEGSVDRVLAKARENIAAAALEDLSLEREKLSILSYELEATRSELTAVDAARAKITETHSLHLDLVADRAAWWVVRVMVAVVGIAALVGLIATGFWPGGEHPSGWLMPLIFICVVIATGLSAYGLLTGGNLARLSVKGQRLVARRIRVWLGESASTAETSRDRQLLPTHDDN